MPPFYKVCATPTDILVIPTEETALLPRSPKPSLKTNLVNVIKRLPEEEKYLKQYETNEQKYKGLGTFLVIFGELATVSSLSVLCYQLFSNQDNNESLQSTGDLDSNKSNDINAILATALIVTMAHAIPIGQLISGPVFLSCLYSIGSGSYGAIKGGSQLAKEYKNPISQTLGFIGGCFAGGVASGTQGGSESLILNFKALKDTCGVFSFLADISHCCAIYSCFTSESDQTQLPR